METSKVKSGFVSIVGLPNAGKSTFLNAIIKDNLAITSKKPQTTRRNLKGIYNDSGSQIVFVDTPGVHKGKNKLDEYMATSIKKSLADIDLLIVMVDLMSYEIDDYNELLKVVEKVNTKKILVINKCDVDEKKAKNSSNEVISKFNNKVSFEKCFCISALKKHNIKEVIECIKNFLPEGERFYNEDDLTDEPMKQIVADMIRQQCLYKLDKEIPHGIAIVVDSMKKSKAKCVNVVATIVCEKDSHKGIIIGKSGSMIKNIGTGARIAIEDFMKEKINLKLLVIVRENWRTGKTLVANYGYDVKKL